MAEIKSKAPSVILEILVKVGDTVAKGQPLLMTEAMKMKMPVVSPDAGVVESIAVEVGTRVNPGVTLLVIA